MPEIAAQAILDQLPVTELEQSLTTFLAPLYCPIGACKPLCPSVYAGSSAVTARWSRRSLSR